MGGLPGVKARRLQLHIPQLMQVGSWAKTRWGQTVRVTSRYLVDGRMYCTYEYGLGGCSEGGAWENELRLVTESTHA